MSGEPVGALLGALGGLGWLDGLGGLGVLVPAAVLLPLGARTAARRVDAAVPRPWGPLLRHLGLLALAAGSVLAVAPGAALARFTATYLLLGLLTPALLWLFRHWPLRVALAVYGVLPAGAVGLVGFTGLSGELLHQVGLLGGCWLVGFADLDGRACRAGAVRCAVLVVALLAPAVLLGPDADLPRALAATGLSVLAVRVRHLLVRAPVRLTGSRTARAGRPGAAVALRIRPRPHREGPGTGLAEATSPRRV